MLAINPNGTSVMDPCVGKEELLDYFFAAGKKIDAIDLVDYGIHRIARFRQADFLMFFKDRLKGCAGGLPHSSQAPATSTVGGIELQYDYYIANPPYNCHETDYVRANKASLQELFPEIGVTNMYSMFVSALITLAKEGALIGLVTFDSFLTAGMHKQLRQQILDECSIHHIILCPTDLFRDQKADVRTCLLILQKGKKYQQKVSVLNRTLNTEEFRTALSRTRFEQVALPDAILSTDRDANEFVIGCPQSILAMFANDRIGDLFPCITGISTGNDKKYVSPRTSESHSVPFYKNPGSRRFFCQADGFLPTDFLEIEKSVPNFMVRNKSLLLKEGITCSSMGVPFTACYLPPGSTFGVNANIIPPEEDIWWLLGYLNSRLVTYFVRGILLRTNMVTSGYVSRVPVATMTLEDKMKLAAIARQAYAHQAKPSNRNDGYRVYLEQIDDIVFNACKLEQDVRHHVRQFCSNLLRLT